MIAEEIAEYVKERGIKQSFLCERTGLSKHCISQALNGKRKLSVDEYASICTALDVSFDFFYHRHSLSETNR